MFEELETAMSNIHRLEEEKKKILQEADETKERLEQQIEQVERTLDDERKSLVADVSRGKAEVLKLMQVITRSRCLTDVVTLNLHVLRVSMVVILCCQTNYFFVKKLCCNFP